MVLRVAVVGSGPSGLYAAEALTDQQEIPVQVDVIDRLPTPFGLVRYGVAPDHFSIRSVRDKLDELFDRSNIAFIGNCTIGEDMSVADVRSRYDAVIFTYGASRDRRLGIPGEDLDGSVAATDFVAWYCGHPDQEPGAFRDLLARTKSAVVIGVGNVAVDVTRVLAKNREELAATDMPEHVLDALANSAIEDIHVLGRRGPAQGAFTTKELRELGELADADVLIDPTLLDLDPVSAALADSNKVVARNIAVMREWAERVPAGRPRRIHMRFLTKPVALLGATHVSSISVERTRIDADGAAVGTGETEEIPAQMVVRSVGYRGVGLPGLPFDEQANVIPHRDGRVIGSDGPIPGCYVAGWIKRGPTGIIGTNKKDATATVAALLDDVRSGLISDRNADSDPVPNAVTTEGWRAIDRAERALGASRDKERVTIHDRDELLRIASGV